MSLAPSLVFLAAAACFSTAPTIFAVAELDAAAAAAAAEANRHVLLSRHYSFEDNDPTEDLSLALDHIEQAIALQPANESMRAGLVAILADRGDHDRALRFLEGLYGRWPPRGKAIDPMLALQWTKLVVRLHRKSEPLIVAEAIDLLEEFRHEMDELAAGLARRNKEKNGTSSKDSNVPLPWRAFYWYYAYEPELRHTLVKLYDETEQYDKALVQLNLVNSLSKKLLPPLYAEGIMLINAGWHRRAYTREKVAALISWLDDREAATEAGASASSKASLSLPQHPFTPIFIVGLGRTGSTLLEELLGRHPDIHAGGEKPDFNDFAPKVQITAPKVQITNKSDELLLDDVTFEPCARPGDRELSEPGALHQLCNSFQAEMLQNMERAGRRRGVAARGAAAAGEEGQANPALPRYITSKMPENVWHLGMLSVCFGGSLPVRGAGARFIVSTRNPRDVAMSTLMTYFHSNADEPSNAWANSLEDFVAYAERISLLVEHWRKVLPPDRFHILEVKYEDLVSSPLETLQHVLVFLGIEPRSDHFVQSRLLLQGGERKSGERRTIEKEDGRGSDNRRVIYTPTSVDAHGPIFKTSMSRWRNYQGFLAPFEERLNALASGGGTANIAPEQVKALLDEEDRHVARLLQENGMLRRN